MVEYRDVLSGVCGKVLCYLCGDMLCLLMLWWVNCICVNAGFMMCCASDVCKCGMAQRDGALMNC